MFLFSSLVLLASSAALVSCGGGGGSDSESFDVMSVKEMRSTNRYYSITGGVVGMRVVPVTYISGEDEPLEGFPQGLVDMEGTYEAGIGNRSYDIRISYMVTAVDTATDEPLRAELTIQFSDSDLNQMKQDENFLKSFGILYGLNSDQDVILVQMPVSTKFIFTPAGALIEHEYDDPLTAGPETIVCPSYANLRKK